MKFTFQWLEMKYKGDAWSVLLLSLYEMSNKNVFHIMAQEKLRIMQEEIDPWSKQFGYWNYWNGKENVVT